jgi:transcription elongation factor GreA
MMRKAPMTVAGAEKLREELRRLKMEERPRIIAAIAEARAHGDLKENAEYHAAREQQSFMEGRIQEIEARLSVAQVIDIKAIANTGKVIFGTTVTLSNISDKKTVTYTIVGEDESDINESKISFSSPIARAMIGKFEGDLIDVQAPEGSIQYEIIEIVH